MSTSMTPDVAELVARLRQQALDIPNGAPIGNISELDAAAMIESQAARIAELECELVAVKQRADRAATKALWEQHEAAEAREQKLLDWQRRAVRWLRHFQTGENVHASKFDPSATVDALLREAKEQP